MRNEEISTIEDDNRKIKAKKNKFFIKGSTQNTINEIDQYLQEGRPESLEVSLLFFFVYYLIYI